MYFNEDGKFLCQKMNIRTSVRGISFCTCTVLIEYRKGLSSLVQSDFVTILRMPLMQYITKLATSQSQKLRSPLPQNIKYVIVT